MGPEERQEGSLADWTHFELRSLSGPQFDEDRKIMRRSVRDIMALDVIVAKPSDVLGGVREIMDAHNIHCLPIVDDEDQLVGLITSSDLMPGFSSKIPVSRIMSTKVYTLTPDADVVTAAQMMRQYRIHHVAVTDGNKVVGVLSSLDLLRLIEEL